MKDITPYASLILTPDSKFKTKKIVMEKLNNFRNLRNYIRKESVFEAHEEGFNYLHLSNKKNKLLNKKAVSLFKSSELSEISENDENEDDEKASLSKDSIITVSEDEEEEDEEHINYKDYLEK